MQPMDPTLAMLIMPVLLFLIGLMGVGAWWVWQHDPWLGALSAWWVVSLLWTRTPQAFESAELCVAGAVALVLIQSLPRAVQALGLRLSLIGVLSQALLAVSQAAGYDPVWLETAGGEVVGMLGNPGYVSLLLAPWVTLTALPVALLLIGAILLAKGKLAILAATVGLAVKAKGWWRECLLIGCLVALGIVWVIGAETLLTTVYLRLTIWTMAVDFMSPLEWLIGRGNGQWITTVPALQRMTQTFDGMFFTYAHSEWIQLFYEHGAVGIVCVLGWLWSHRAMFRGPSAGAVAAILVMSTGWFIFHLANVGLPCLVILGVATRREEEADDRTTRTPMDDADAAWPGGACCGERARVAVVGETPAHRL